jgi:hypothetical protein
MDTAVSPYPHIGKFPSREIAEANRPDWEESHPDLKPMRPAPFPGDPTAYTLEWSPPVLNPAGYKWGRPVTESVDGTKPAPTANPFRVIEAEEFAAGEIVEPDWLVDELFPVAGLGMTYGGSGEGKTFWLTDQACAIHRGIVWRDRVVKKTRAVLVIAEGASFYKLRLKAYSQRHGVPLSELPAIVPVAPNLFKGNDVAELIAALKVKGAGYVLVDPLAQCDIGADESSAKDMGIVIANCKAIESALGCFVHVSHHIGKDAAKGPRGTSAFKPAVDALLQLEGDGSTGTVTADKVKDAAGGARFGFTLEFEELGVSRKTGKPYGSLVVIHTDAEPSAKPRRRMTQNKQAVYSAFLDLAQRGPVTSDALITAGAALLPFDATAGKRDQRRTHATTALRALLKDRTIFERDDRTLSDTSAIEIPASDFEGTSND